MGERELGRDIEKLIRDYCKSKNLKMTDPKIKKVIREIDINLSSRRVNDNCFGQEYKRGDKDYEDLVELHKKMVQESVNYIKSRPGVRKLIEDKKSEIMREWNEGLPEELHTEPDLRMYFGVDGLDESVEIGEWTPATDSYLGIYVGNISIINSM